jgi:hypothetical protein
MVNKIYFNYRSINGFLDINTLSPSGANYYKICNIEEISMAWWTSKIAFYGSENEIVYHRSNVLVAWQNPFDKLNFVKWSSDGLYALIFEYQRDILSEYVFICLTKDITYRISPKVFEGNFIGLINNLSFDSVKIEQSIKDFGIAPQSTYKDLIKKFPNKWYPQKAYL